MNAKRYKQKNNNRKKSVDGTAKEKKEELRTWLVHVIFNNPFNLNCVFSKATKEINNIKISIMCMCMCVCIYACSWFAFVGFINVIIIAMVRWKNCFFYSVQFTADDRLEIVWMNRGRNKNDDNGGFFPVKTRRSINRTIISNGTELNQICCNNTRCAWCKMHA